MSFKPIRQYFRDRFKELDSKYEEHTDAFNTENIASLNLDKAYHIFYASADTSMLNHLTTKDTVNATVSIFSKGYRDPIEALDDTMDFSNKFRIACMNPEYANTGEIIKDVSCVSIEASPINTQNDNSIVCRLQFRIMVVFGLGVDSQCEC